MADETKESLIQFRNRRIMEIIQLPPEKRLEALKELAQELMEHAKELQQKEKDLKQEEIDQEKEIEEVIALELKGKEELATLDRILPKQKDVKLEDLFKPAEELEDKLKDAPRLNQNQEQAYARTPNKGDLAQAYRVSGEKKQQDLYSSYTEQEEEGTLMYQNLSGPREQYDSEKLKGYKNSGDIIDELSGKDQYSGKEQYKS
ncbi:MAG: hypothetical protein Q7K43_00950 [Candidatus Woesearchaeota archaeon]|nr:hypothetical protein [Candidatus Woesearchaeota archaeon]